MDFSTEAMKKIAIHQPNFLPWLGYFYKMKQCDVFVILDDVLVSNSGSYFTQMNIKNTDGKKLQISLPKRKHAQNALINEVLFSENYPFFCKKFLKTLQECYSKAPYFRLHFDNIERILHTSFERLYKLNIELIKYCAKSLNINCQVVLASSLNSAQKKEARIIDLVKKSSGDIYISGNGAKKYQKEEDFISNGVQLIYSDFKIQPYPQLHGNFIGGLSVIDFLFNTNGERF